MPLSITTTLNGPYRDSFDDSHGVIRYSYQGEDPRRWDNVGLKKAMAAQAPLVYFHPVARPGRYLATYPVFVVADNEPGLTFSVQLDAPSILELPDFEMTGEDRGARRAYYTATVKRRAHQASFRERVLMAYREMCALCRLRHGQLLDAAHIVADADPEGEPHVSNGLALCKLHHAAFDSFFLTVTPEYRIVVQKRILDETDGPMLVVGLQQLHGQPIQLPKSVPLRPDQDRPALLIDEATQAITEALYRIYSVPILHDHDLVAVGVTLGDLFGALNQLADLLATRVDQCANAHPLKVGRNVNLVPVLIVLPSITGNVVQPGLFAKGQVIRSRQRVGRICAGSKDGLDVGCGFRR